MLFTVISCDFLLLAIYSILGSKATDVTTTTSIRLREMLKKSNEGGLIQYLNTSRRILEGTEVKDNSRPYMVYLKLPAKHQKFGSYRSWLCGGVIIHEDYVLTSAACIEDVKYFYIVSGTNSHYEGEDEYNNPCFKNGAKKAVWKCIPRNYVFDGHENDNIRWMNNDIAIVKVEDEFNFYRRIKGCDFIPRPIAYNNQSKQYENPNNIATLAGWGTVYKYKDSSDIQNQGNNQVLLETNAILISKSICKRRWGARYHNIIDNYMICTKDIETEMSDLCKDKYVDCTEIMHSDENDEYRRGTDTDKFIVHSAYHNTSDGRKHSWAGGFCENDHGGPLVYGSGSNAVVIGIISACLVKEKTNKCYGPFLYTSVFKNRQLINCAIYKQPITNCKQFRSSEGNVEEVISWIDHPDGPAQNELQEMRRDMINKYDSTNNEAKSVTVERTEISIVKK